MMRLVSIICLAMILIGCAATQKLEKASEDPVVKEAIEKIKKYVDDKDVIDQIEIVVEKAVREAEENTKEEIKSQIDLIKSADNKIISKSAERLEPIVKETVDKVEEPVKEAVKEVKEQVKEEVKEEVTGKEINEAIKEGPGTKELKEKETVKAKEKK